MDGGRLYSIGDLTRRTGLAVRTIRLYSDCGIERISPAGGPVGQGKAAGAASPVVGETQSQASDMASHARDAGSQVTEQTSEGSS
jgi:hypothetical protein